MRRNRTARELTDLDKQREQVGLTAIQLLISKPKFSEKINYKDIYKAHAILNDYQKVERHTDRDHGKEYKYYPEGRWKTNGNRKRCWRCSSYGKKTCRY